MSSTRPRRPPRSYTISLENRKPRGSGHERLGEILGAARALFAEHGVENVTTRQIAAKVGISQTALFTYYRTRDEILVRLMEDAFADLASALAEFESNSLDIRDWLQRLVAGYVAFGLKYPDEYRLAFMVIKPRKKSGEPPDRPGIVQKAGLPVFRRLADKIAAAMANGAIRDDIGSPNVIAQVLWASIHGLTSLLIARPRPHFPWAEVDELIRVQTEILLGALPKRRPE